jgi:hypothetical protein
MAEATDRSIEYNGMLGLMTHEQWTNYSAYSTAEMLKTNGLETKHANLQNTD